MNLRLPGRTEIAGLVAIALALPGAWLAPRLFFASWLAAWWFVLGLMLGAMANLWIHRLSGGRWGEVLRPAALLAARRMPLALLLFLPMAAGLSRLYPWAADPGGWAHRLSRPAFASLWLQPGFFWCRMAAYAVLWWWLSRPATLATKGRAAGALALYALGGTLASVDLLMSLVPGWFSTAFGLVVLSGQALGGAALATLWLALRMPQALATRAEGRPPPGRDLGNLLLMWLMTWAYLAFMEFLIIWAENLPPEIAWYVPRLQTGWFAVGVALVVLQLALPLLALLQRRLKDRPARLAPIAALLLLTQLLNSAWLVLPSVDASSVHGWWLVPLLALGMGLLLFGALPAGLERHAQVIDTPEARHVRP
jgi:hypothetical protein